MAAPSDAARSFVEIAADSHFPIQNLPYGIHHPLLSGFLGVEGSERFAFGVDGGIVDQHIQGIYFAPNLPKAPIEAVRIRDLHWQDIYASTKLSR